MSLFFARARSLNEAIILESLGRPVSAALNWKCVPFPCISKTKRFQVDKYNIRFQTEEVQTKDDVIVTMNLQAIFKVDTESDGGILNAYKKLQEGGEANKGKNEDDVLSLRSAVQNIITDVVKRQILKMTMKEVLQFNWLLMDNVFVETSFILKENSILLKSLQLDEICEYEEISNVSEELLSMKKENNQDIPSTENLNNGVFKALEVQYDANKNDQQVVKEIKMDQMDQSASNGQRYIEYYFTEVKSKKSLQERQAIIVSSDKETLQHISEEVEHYSVPESDETTMSVEVKCETINALNGNKEDLAAQIVVDLETIKESETVNALKGNKEDATVQIGGVLEPIKECETINVLKRNKEDVTVQIGGDLETIKECETVNALKGNKEDVTVQIESDLAINKYGETINAVKESNEIVTVQIEGEFQNGI